MVLYLIRLEFALVLALSTILVLSFSSNHNNYYFCQAQLSNNTNFTNSTTSSPGTTGNETSSTEVTSSSAVTNGTTTTTTIATTSLITTTAPTSTSEATSSPPTTESTTTTITSTSTTTTTTAVSTSTTTVTTTTSTTLPTRGPPPAQLQTGILPAGMVRIRPGTLITNQQVVELADSYLRKQQPFVLPLDQLPQNWNFTTNISSVEDNGWSIILTFTVVDLGKTYIPTAVTVPPPTTTPAITPPSSPTATSATTGKGSTATTTTLPSKDTADTAILTEEQHIANALARVLSDACNVRYYRPPSFTGYFEACTGRSLPLGVTTDEDYASGDWSHRSLPIPRQARDPTNSASSTIPEWALVLSCIAAAILGWAVGMLVAFAVCPKLPYKSLKDRLLDDEDEIEKELSDVVRAKLASLCERVGCADGSNGGHDDDAGLLKHQEMQETLLPPTAFMTSPQRQQHYDGDPMDLLMNRKSNNNKKGKGNYSRHEEL